MSWPEWVRCAPYLEAALRKGSDTFSIADVADSIATGKMQFWPGRESAMVTQLFVGSHGKECNIYLAGGTLTELEQMLPAVEQFAIDNGCRVMSVVGRAGWGRSFLVQRAGYVPTAVVFGKELT